MHHVFKLKINRLNNRDFNIDQNNRDYDFCHNQLALEPVTASRRYEKVELPFGDKQCMCSRPANSIMSSATSVNHYPFAFVSFGKVFLCVYPAAKQLRM